MASKSFITLTTRNGGSIEFDSGLSITQDRSNIITHRFGNGAMRQTIKGTRPTTYELSGTISALTSAEVNTLLSNLVTYGTLPNYITYTVFGSSCKFICDKDVKVSHMSGDYYRVDLTLVEVY